MTMRKTDRRTLMTIEIIKDALLELLHKTAYERITITAQCKQAEITRATFYLHFDNVDQVVDGILDDALRLSELDPLQKININLAQKETQTNAYDPDIALPACQRASSLPKYQKLFMDDSLSYIILNKLYHKEYEVQVPRMMQTYHISEKQAANLFLYTLHGNFALNKALKWQKNAEWYDMQNLIHKILEPKK